MNNNTKHTPGPWTLHEIKLSDSDQVVAYKIQSNNYHPEYCIANIGAVTWNGESYAPLMGSDANAHLIAAAPDMFEALERISFECSDTPGQLSEASLGVIKILAEKAIKKAKGE